VAFLLDGQLLASVSRDESVRLWHVQTKEAIQKFTTRRSTYNLSFSNDGLYLKTERGGLFQLSCLYRSVS
jgi:WD40 repeat protein